MDFNEDQGLDCLVLPCFTGRATLEATLVVLMPRGLTSQWRISHIVRKQYLEIEALVSYCILRTGICYYPRSVSSGTSASVAHVRFRGGQSEDLFRGHECNLLQRMRSKLLPCGGSRTSQERLESIWNKIIRYVKYPVASFACLLPTHAGPMRRRPVR